VEGTLGENIEDIGYFLLFVYTFGGGFFGLATASVLASMGKMSLILSIAIAAASNFVGSSFLFYFSRNSKAEVLKYLKNHRRKLALAHLLIKKNGTKVIFIQKFIYGVKTLVPMAIGMTAFEARKFLILNLLASIVWAVLIGVAAYFSGGAILVLIGAVEDRPWVAPIVLASVLGIIYFYFSKTTKRRAI